MALKSEYLNPSKAIVLEFTQRVFEEMVSHARQKYSIPEFDPKLKVCFRKTRVYSWGGMVDGVPYLNLSAYNILWMVPEGPNCTRKYREYKFLLSQPDIGEFKGTWKKWMAALVAHEIGHAVQFYADEHPHIYTLFDPKVAADLRPHGKFWQAIYRDFRITFVNTSRFDMNYTVVPERKSSKVQQRKFLVKAKEKKGGRFVEYWVGDYLVGKFFSKHRFPIMKYDPSEDAWVPTEHMKLVDARNALMEEFFGKSA